MSKKVTDFTVGEIFVLQTILTKPMSFEQLGVMWMEKIRPDVQEATAIIAGLRTFGLIHGAGTEAYHCTPKGREVLARVHSIYQKD